MELQPIPKATAASIVFTTEKAEELRQEATALNRLANDQLWEFLIARGDATADLRATHQIQFDPATGAVQLVSQQSEDPRVGDQLTLPSQGVPSLEGLSLQQVEAIAEGLATMLSVIQDGELQSEMRALHNASPMLHNLVMVELTKTAG